MALVAARYEGAKEPHANHVHVQGVRAKGLSQVNWQLLEQHVVNLQASLLAEEEKGFFNVLGLIAM